MKYGKIIILKFLQFVNINFAGPIKPFAINGISMVFVTVNYFIQFVIMKIIKYLILTVNVGDIWLFNWFSFFGWSVAIITDNGNHFANMEFKKFFAKKGIIIKFGPIIYPQIINFPENTIKFLKK